MHITGDSAPNSPGRGPVREVVLDASRRPLYNTRPNTRRKEHRAHKTRRREKTAAEREEGEGFFALQGMRPRQMLHVFFHGDRRAA